MTFTLAELRDLVLRRRVEHPIDCERDFESVAAELRHSACELTHMAGKLMAGVVNPYSFMAWAGRTQLQLILLCHMLGIDLDGAVRPAIYSRGMLSPPEPTPGANGTFRISAGLWLERPSAVEQMLRGVHIRSMRFQREPRAWYITGYSDHFRELISGESIPHYSVTITETAKGVISVDWQEEERRP